MLFRISMQFYFYSLLPCRKWVRSGTPTRLANDRLGASYLDLNTNQYSVLSLMLRNLLVMVVVMNNLGTL